jgi:hypothetical protein
MSPISKTETLVKRFEEEGISCTVTVTKNARVRHRQATNFLNNEEKDIETHDHRVTGEVNGKLIADQYTEVWDQIMMMVNKVEYVCSVDAKRLAAEKRDPHVTEMLFKKGYQRL